MLASELYAKTQSAECKGSFECHWCGAKCGSNWTHDEPAPMIGVKRPTLAKRYGSPYVCSGCWLYRRRSQTVNFLTQIPYRETSRMVHPQKDRQRLSNHSWLLTEKGFFGLRFPEDSGELYQFLLKPFPLLFCLSLVEGGEENHLQLAQVSENFILTAETRIPFTYNNSPHFYTIYELTEAIKTSPKGKEVGVGILMRVLGDPPANLFEVKEEKPRGRGRPKPPEDSKTAMRKLIAASGKSA